MWEVVLEPAMVDRAIKDFKRNLSIDSEIVHRRISFPSPEGPIEGEVLWNPNASLWAYFSPEQSNPRWYGFGTRLSEENKPQYISIQITPAITEDMRRSAAVIRGPSGNLHIAHRGYLAGGRTAVGTSEFTEMYAGPPAEDVLWTPDGSIRKYFVIGEIDCRNIITKIHEFVSEAERIRDLMREKRRSS
jgi:hypothetical protein